MANKDEVRVKFCPKCKSTDIKYTFGFGNLFGVIPRMKCGKCGNEASIFPILVTSKKALSKTVKSKKIGGKKK